MTPAEKLLGRLEGVRSRGPHKWAAKCPAHDDARPSLMIEEKSDGTLLVACMAACATGDVMASVGLSLADLFPDNPQYQSRGRQRQRFSAGDVVQVMDIEIGIVVTVAHDIVHGLEISAEDLDRASQAWQRLGRIREVCQ